MKTLFETSVKAANGGRNGVVKSEDGQFELAMSMPKSLGGTGEGSNPEQLFAAGYAACFSNAALHVAKMQKLDVQDVPVKANVGLAGLPSGAFALTVSLEVEVELLQEQAIELIKQAHQVCPYSNATRGNVDVAISVNGEQI